MSASLDGPFSQNLTGGPVNSCSTVGRQCSMEWCAMRNDRQPLLVLALHMLGLHSLAMAMAVKTCFHFTLLLQLIVPCMDSLTG